MHPSMKLSCMASILIAQATAIVLPLHDATIQARAVNPDTGVAISSWSGSPKKGTCTGSHFANTNVNAYSTACINLSKATAIQIEYVTCAEVIIDYFSETDCTGTQGEAAGRYVVPDNGSDQSTYCYSLLYDTPPGHASGRVSIPDPSYYCQKASPI